MLKLQTDVILGGCGQAWPGIPKEAVKLSEGSFSCNLLCIVIVKKKNRIRRNINSKKKNFLYVKSVYYFNLPKIKLPLSKFKKFVVIPFPISCFLHVNCFHRYLRISLFLLFL